MEARPYQVKAIDDTRQAMRESRKIILGMSTGSGKTFIGKYMIEGALKRGLRAAFVVDRLTLLEQTCDVFEAFGIDFGVIQGDHFLTDDSKKFQICSAQTLSRRDVEGFDLMVVDEVHVLHKGILKMLKENSHTYFVGLTATPWTKGLGLIWEKLVTGPTTAELIRDGYLSEYVAYGPGAPDLSNVRTTAGDYNKKDLSEVTDTSEITGDIVEHWIKLASDRCTILAAVDVAHAEHLCKAFTEKGIKSDVVHCYRTKEENKQSILNFRNGETQVLCSVDMISRGFDMPQADCLIIARPTKSLIYHIQIMGRILRIFKNKKNAIILDHAGNIERLGFPDDDFEMILDTRERGSRKMMCPFCGWQGNAKLTDKCPECGLQIVALPPIKKEKLPKPCSVCKVLFVGSICPACGHERTRQSTVATKDELLVELQKGRHKATGGMDKEKLYSKLLAAAKAAGFAEGWSAHQYRNYYGTWPAKKQGVEIDQSFYNYLTSTSRQKMMKIIWSVTDKSAA